MVVVPERTIVINPLELIVATDISDDAYKNGELEFDVKPDIVNAESPKVFVTLLRAPMTVVILICDCNLTKYACCWLATLFVCVYDCVNVGPLIVIVLLPT